jgi:hypothetical protein
MGGGTFAFLATYILVSILIGLYTVIKASTRPRRRYERVGASKGRWVLASLLGLASIVILMPGSIIVAVCYRLRFPPPLPRPSQPSRQRTACPNPACANGRVRDHQGNYTFEDFYTCPDCLGTGWVWAWQ